MFVLDYALTLQGARLAQSAGRHNAFSGGYELTPIYREDIAALRRISPRFAGVLVLVAFLLLVEWWLTHSPGRPNPLFEGFLGLLLLIQPPSSSGTSGTSGPWPTRRGRGGCEARSSTPGGSR